MIKKRIRQETLRLIEKVKFESKFHLVNICLFRRAPGVVSNLLNFSGFKFVFIKKCLKSKLKKYKHIYAFMKSLLEGTNENTKLY